MGFPVLSLCGFFSDLEQGTAGVHYKSEMFVKLAGALPV